MNFFEDTDALVDDVEWNQFINTSRTSPTKPHKPNHATQNHSPNFTTSHPPMTTTTSTTTTSHPHLNGNSKYTSPQRAYTRPHPDEHIESMDYDTIKNVDSPMHMTDWLSSSSPFDSDPLFPSFSTNLSLSNDNPKQQDRIRTPQKSNHTIFATPADDHWDYR